MSFAVWRAVFWGCVALASAVAVAVRPASGPARARAVGSAGFVLVAMAFFILARSRVLRDQGVWYPAYRHAAYSLFHIAMAIASVGVTCLLWWIASSLPPEQTTPRVHRLIGRWLVTALISFWLFQGCILSVPIRTTLFLKMMVLCIALVCIISLTATLVLYLDAWKRRTVPPEAQVDPPDTSAA